jgi:acetylornithine/N-succinyldiaminopimelate aminotransferase
MTNKDLQERFAQVAMGNYGLPPIALVSGQGCRVTDADGRTYLDLLAGIAVNALGHAHPAVVDAVSRQIATLAHTSNLYVTEPAVSLAETLVAGVGGNAKVFFANSGAEANEAAFKLARLFGGENRREIISTHGSFHGRTMGSLALTGQPSKQAGFTPLPGPVTFVDYGDAGALAAAVTEHTAALIVEPIQGEGGVIVPPDDYLAQARRITADAGALLILDEVQTGIGRTGTLFAHERDGIRPDVITLAKGLGGGLPIGACIGLDGAGDVLGRGQHGSTFGGNLVSAAAALAVLTTIEQQNLLEHVRVVGDHLAARIEQIDHPLLAGMRGRGLLRALVLSAPQAGAVETAAREAGFLVGAVAPNAVRLAPPLIITAAELDEFVDALPAILSAAS